MTPPFRMSAFPRFALASALVCMPSLLCAAPVDYLRDVRPILATNCFQCHGAKVQKGNLRVDTVAALLKGGDEGPSIVAGKSDDSLLVRAVIGAEGVAKMPFKGPGLSAAQVATIKSWIDAGAKAPEKEVPDDGRGSKTHWAFVAPVRSIVPALKDATGARNAIDLFVRAKLEDVGLVPAPEADRATLIRRMSLDLTGLPPSLAEVDAYVNDTAPDADTRLIERLLASPAYGERWGRHWLDVARYADSNGYSIDAPREIWKYRDWVIDAINRDLPFDRFAIEQLAGDMLPDATQSNKIATGFHRNTQINQEGGVDPEQFRVEAVSDRVNTTGVAFLGLTIGCCRCHDHKYDPLTQNEYYRLFAFFNNCDEPTLAVAPPDRVAKKEEIRKKVEELEASLKLDEVRVLGSIPDAERETHRDIYVIHNLDPLQRTDRQKVTINRFISGREPALKPKVTELNKLKSSEPKFASTMVVAERKTPRATHIMVGGDFTRLGARVEPGVPAALPPLASSTPNRLDFARWLVDTKNPLTARVAVNRVWQAYFGKGLVETENDFGTQGSPPTHPELLDWLASEFMARGWSLKELHRSIVSSATYRQSSRIQNRQREVDPTNRLLSRQNRFRLEAEAIRDAALTASGLLARKIGGPGVRPPQPDGVFKFTQVKREWFADTGPDRFRRGLYTYFWRAAPHPALLVFDAPDAFATCTRRIRSNNPLQALTLLNDPAFIELSSGLAKRAIAQGPTDDAGRLAFVFRLCLGRSPTEAEAERLATFLAAQRAEFAADAPAVKQLTDASDPETAAWIAVARVLFNLDEFITRE
ncbi:MAG: PSD1 and planctomycete cytochrome C domain-containing protein [Gemmataceae bacterium]